MNQFKFNERHISMAGIWLFVLIILAIGIHDVHSVARTIKVPLKRTITKTAGQFNQPVASYYMPLEIGTPPKEFLIQFEVGLADSFVPHYTWNPFKINLHYGKGFQCKVSSTCMRDDREVTIEYQHCKLTGRPYEDIVVFKGSYALGSVQNNQTISNVYNGNSTTTFENSRNFAWAYKFLAMSDASDARFKDLPIDGFIGLSPQSQSSSVLDSEHGAELTLGGVDTGRYQGQIYWHHLSGGAISNDWSLNLQFVSVGNQPVSCANLQCQVSFSSAVNEIYGPQADVERIYQLFNATKTSGSYLNFVDCNRVSRLPYMSFTIDGIPYGLLPTNYIRQTSDGRCYVAILPNIRSPTSDKSWLLGTNFLGAYYSTFDMTYKQIGFASMR